MDKAALLTEFQARVDEFERFQGFIHKAKGQVGKFASAVVEKVIKDNEARSLAVVEQIIPLVGDIEDVIQGLSDERQQVLDGRQLAQFALEELELRLAIGEMSDDDFLDAAGPHQETVGSIDGKVAGIEAELNKYRGVMTRWTDLGTASGMLTKPAPTPAPTAAPTAAPTPPPEPPRVVGPPKSAPAPVLVAPVVASVEDDVSVDEDVEVGGFEEERPAARVEHRRIAEDVSAVFETPAPAPNAAIPVRAPAAPAAPELEALGDGDEIEVDAASEEIPPSSKDEPRRAVLLYQEGTADEQIYPFNGDEMTLGRGRDNDIQVKNDSKVSRYHCKLFRRGGSFYIEDNKSANGTLVNGERITERRLFGGEEIIIGETFFRFRIMD
jgi:hypothetical protein